MPEEPMGKGGAPPGRAPRAAENPDGGPHGADRAKASRGLEGPQ